MNSLMALITLCLFFFSLYLVVKIYKLVQFNDPTLLLSIVSVTLSLACMEAFCIMDSVRMYAPEDSEIVTWNYVTLMEQIDAFKVLFIYLAFLCDLYKWCLFIIATREYNLQDSESFKRQKCCVLMTTYAFELVLIAGFFSIFGLIIKESGNRPS